MRKPRALNSSISPGILAVIPNSEKTVDRAVCGFLKPLRLLPVPGLVTPLRWREKGDMDFLPVVLGLDGAEFLRLWERLKPLDRAGEFLPLARGETFALFPSPL